MSGGATASFVYDADGQRVKGTINGVTTVYVGNHYEKQGSTIKKYYSPGGQRVAMRENGTLYWLLADHLGSTAKGANGSSLTGELRYKAWGETRYTWGTVPTMYLFTGQREESTVGGFAPHTPGFGAVRRGVGRAVWGSLPAPQLYFYNARWYDPALGRFVQPDTVVPEPSNPRAFDC